MVKAVFANYLTPNAEIHTYTVANGNSISKGTLLQLSDPYTASMAENFSLGSSTTSGAFIGIAYHDKEANDGATTIAVLKGGRADIRASGTITVGAKVYCAGNDEVKALSAANTSHAISANLLDSMSVGIAEETASDGEVIIVRFNK